MEAGYRPPAGGGTPTRARRTRSPAAAGFTLLELLVVLAIAVVVLTLTPPLLTGTLPALQLKGAAREMVSALRYMRGRAITSRQDTRLTLDLDARTYTLSGRTQIYRLPDETEVQMVTANSELQGERVAAIRFYPDGSSTGGRITLTRGDNRYQLDVDWLTGRVSLDE